MKSLKELFPFLDKFSIKKIGLDKLIILLLTGIFFVVLSFPTIFPSEKEQKKNSVPVKTTEELDNPSTSEEYILYQEEKLKKILKKVEGIGEVEVMITIKASKESVPLKDIPYDEETTNENDSAGGKRESNSINTQEQSVMVTTKDGESVPYVVKEIEPEIEGVVVIAQGGGNSNINQEIIEAVEVLFGVPVHKIKVMKMNH